MKRTFICLFILALISAVGLALSEAVFEIPSNVITIEDAAFESLNEETVFIRKSVTNIGENAFGNKVTKILGYIGSEAEKYALRNGIKFCPVDITDISIGKNDLWMVQGETIRIMPSAQSNIGSLRYRVIISKDDTTVIGESACEDGDDIAFSLKDAGTYNIYVEASNGFDTSAVCFENALTVEAVIAFADSELSIDVGEILLWLDVSEKRDVAIIDYDESIVTFDGHTVKGLKAGKTTLNAQINCGDGRIVNGSCEITVSDPVKHTAIGFEKLFVTLHTGGEYKLNLSVQPTNAKKSRVDYFSSDENVARVDKNGVLYAISEGNAVITAVSQLSSGVTNTCKVFVVKEDALPLEGVIIGINPGHQIRGINTLYPISPGSSTMKVGCKVGTQGLVTKTPEYVVALDVSLILRDILVENGATVVMTRTTNDAYLTNIQRADILNQANVDAAIQVHCNGGATSSYGMSSYYRTTGSWVEESKWLAECMLNHMQKETAASKASMHVCNTYMSLNYSFTPACLVEMGYLTNAEEEKLLINPDYQRKLAYGMYEGLLEYFGRQ